MKDVAPSDRVIFSQEPSVTKEQRHGEFYTASFVPCHGGPEWF
jgi:hypothetical protein